MKAYIDTSAILAVLNAEDEHHAAASAAWAEAVTGGIAILTSNYVVVEAVSLLQRRHGIPAARRFVDDMLPKIEILWAGPETHDVGLASMFAASSKRGPSLVYCVGFELIRKEKVALVLAYDRHFERLGFSPPKAVNGK